jgi:hypothetical protein
MAALPLTAACSALECLAAEISTCTTSVRDEAQSALLKLRGVLVLVPGGAQQSLLSRCREAIVVVNGLYNRIKKGKPPVAPESEPRPSAAKRQRLQEQEENTEAALLQALAALAILDDLRTPQLVQAAMQQQPHEWGLELTLAVSRLGRGLPAVVYTTAAQLLRAYLEAVGEEQRDFHDGSAAEALLAYSPSAACTAAIARLLYGAAGLWAPGPVSRACTILCAAYIRSSTSLHERQLLAAALVQADACLPKWDSWNGVPGFGAELLLAVMEAAHLEGGPQQPEQLDAGTSALLLRALARFPSALEAVAALQQQGQQQEQQQAAAAQLPDPELVARAAQLPAPAFLAAAAIARLQAEDLGGLLAPFNPVSIWLHISGPVVQDMLAGSAQLPVRRTAVLLESIKEGLQPYNSLSRAQALVWAVASYLTHRACDAASSTGRGSRSGGGTQGGRGESAEAGAAAAALELRQELLRLALQPAAVGEGQAPPSRMYLEQQRLKEALMRAAEGAASAAGLHAAKGTTAQLTAAAQQTQQQLISCIAAIASISQYPMHDSAEAPMLLSCLLACLCSGSGEAVLPLLPLAVYAAEAMCEVAALEILEQQAVQAEQQQQQDEQKLMHSALLPEVIAAACRMLPHAADAVAAADPSPSSAPLLAGLADLLALLAQHGQEQHAVAAVQESRLGPRLWQAWGSCQGQPAAALLLSALHRLRLLTAGQLGGLGAHKRLLQLLQVGV